MLKTYKYTLRIMPVFYSVIDVRVGVSAGFIEGNCRNTGVSDERTASILKLGLL
jgi:hypothetical protein